ncbi:MAG: 1-deoxy-D-xylulose-5-phosphate synthase [Bacilli bacterium]|nr:1-deoxy-D-xylulose-5-phosphate synthase [Bacilli bacterium]MBN2877398.1 1-deoxy-D-xylulose-5-phosphate synthase [Bacilli bacterium]
MNLLDIKDPKFLKELSIQECDELATEIRSFLIEKISKTGGHLSSNLGIVELTIALHRAFNSPEDRFIFDVGHQSYVHKILTGRAKDFDTLRQFKGLSGYQKRSESPHDPWEAGHSSTAIAALAGFESAKQINHETNRNIAIVGDGSLNSGLSFEALNYLGHCTGLAPIIILNDNEMSISKNVGRMSKLLNKLRSSKMYLAAVNSKTRFPKFIYNMKVRISNSIRGFANNLSMFDQFGFSYYGPIDGHDIKTLDKFLNIAKKKNLPTVIHIVTKKGKGYPPAESDTLGKWHGTGPFDIKSGDSLNKLPENQKTWSTIFSELIEAYAVANEKFRIIIPAMIYGSSLVEFEQRHPDQIIDVGICESFAICYSTALAMNDLQIFVPIYSSFLQRAYDQVSHDLARQDVKIVIGIDRAGLVGGDGDTHQGIYDIAYLRHIPNIEIVQPSTMLEAKQLLDYAFNTAKHSVAIRYSRGSSEDVDVSDFERILSPTWTEIDNSGTKNLIAYGDNFIRMRDYISKHKLPINLFNARFIKPLDNEMVKKILTSELPTTVLEDVSSVGGLGSAIFEYAQANDLPIQQLKIFGLPDEFIEHGSVEEVQKQYGLDTETIIKRMN